MQTITILLIFILTLSFTACQNEATYDAIPVTQETRSPTETTNAAITPISPINAPKSPISTPVSQTEPTLVLTPVSNVAEETVVINAANNLQLRGTLFGRGKTLVIIIKGPDENEADWVNQARAIAAQGFMVLTYTTEKKVDSTETVDFDQQLNYLRSAIKFASDKGASEHVLFGVGKNGIVAIKAASQTNPKAVVAISTPLESGLLSITPVDLKAISGPKLFIDTESSPTQPDAVQMFEWVNSPKTWRFLPGQAQGAKMYDEAYSQNLTDFIAAFFLLRLS